MCARPEPLALAEIPLPWQQVAAELAGGSAAMKIVLGPSLLPVVAVEGAHKFLLLSLYPFHLQLD